MLKERRQVVSTFVGVDWRTTLDLYTSLKKKCSRLVIFVKSETQPFFSYDPTLFKLEKSLEVQSRFSFSIFTSIFFKRVITPKFRRPFQEERCLRGVVYVY